MFWNPEVITTTGKSLRITQITFNIIYIMRTNINQGRIQSLAVMIVLLINNDQNPISYLIPYVQWIDAVRRIYQFYLH